jgi:hypothetical protein
MLQVHNEITQRSSIAFLRLKPAVVGFQERLHHTLIHIGGRSLSAPQPHA